MDKTSWIYRSGDVFLPKRIRIFLETYLVGNERTLYFITLWNFMHLLSGVLFALFDSFVLKVPNPYATYFVIHTLWELWQLFIGMTTPDLRGFIDILNDTFFGFLGLFVVLKGKQ